MDNTSTAILVLLGIMTFIILVLTGISARLLCTLRRFEEEDEVSLLKV